MAVIASTGDGPTSRHDASGASIPSIVRPWRMAIGTEEVGDAIDQLPKLVLHGATSQTALHADGTTTATSPHGRTLHSHSPPTAAA